MIQGSNLMMEKILA